MLLLPEPDFLSSTRNVAAEPISKMLRFRECHLVILLTTVLKKKKKKPTWVIMRTQTAKYINDEEGDRPSDSETLFLKSPLQVLPGFSLI